MSHPNPHFPFGKKRVNWIQPRLGSHENRVYSVKTTTITINSKHNDENDPLISSNQRSSGQPPFNRLEPQKPSNTSHSIGNRDFPQRNGSELNHLPQFPSDCEEKEESMLVDSPKSERNGEAFRQTPVQQAPLHHQHFLPPQPSPRPFTPQHYITPSPYSTPHNSLFSRPNSNVSSSFLSHTSSTKSTISHLYHQMDDMEIDNEEEGMIDPKSFVCSEENRIGKGASASVHRVHSNRTNKNYALKIVQIPDDEMRRQMAEHEVRLLLKLRGRPGIIQLYNDPGPIVCPGSIKLVMELGEHDLACAIRKWKFEALEKMGKEKEQYPAVFCGIANVLQAAGRNHSKIFPIVPKEHIRRIWREMLEAIREIQHFEQGIIHGDLKPANFLFVQGHLKLIDFGIAQAIDHNETHVQQHPGVGTYNYISPEAAGRGSQLGYPAIKRKASDIWSLGMILYEMVYGVTALAHVVDSIDDKYKKLRALVSDAPITVPTVPCELAQFQNTIRQCLQKDERKRPSVDELLSSELFPDFLRSESTFITLINECPSLDPDLKRTLIRTIIGG
ncbi:putative serine/threonine protein kinase [Blattamonas nauphoetae]|uniref:Serine/threonine protein kinase n=1 Tax=Blattamonas nauphoetae TaxID=2049346 RepID=A0ABQ9XLK8_9EUKA|nr:putative serine/threonine protein kinase [Blattamonas nauphoetae]